MFKHNYEHISVKYILIILLIKIRAWQEPANLYSRLQPCVSTAILHFESLKCFMCAPPPGLLHNEELKNKVYCTDTCHQFNSKDPCILAITLQSSLLSSRPHPVAVCVLLNSYRLFSSQVLELCICSAHCP